MGGSSPRRLLAALGWLRADSRRWLPVQRPYITGRKDSLRAQLVAIAALLLPQAVVCPVRDVRKLYGLHPVRASTSFCAGTWGRALGLG